MNGEQRGKYTGWLKRGILAECILVLVFGMLVMGKQEREASERTISNQILSIENEYIKWVDFTVSYEALCQAYEWDVKTHGSEHEISWVELLAYTAAKTGGEFDRNALKILDKAAEKLSEGETAIEELTEDLKYYSYYREAYDAAIGGLVGEYWEENPEYDGDDALTGASGNEIPGKDSDGKKTETDGTLNPERSEDGRYLKRYGLKGYFPLARGFDYTHYDDFGVGRSYGYQRKHLG